MGRTRVDVDVFARRLEEFTQLQCRYMRQDSSALPDTPGEPFPDPYLLGGEFLYARRRTRRVTCRRLHWR